MDREGDNPCLALIGIPAVLALMALWRGLVVVILWRWFVVPQFHLGELRLRYAVGMTYLIASFESYSKKSDYDFWTISAMGFAWPGICLFFGWITTLFL